MESFTVRRELVPFAELAPEVQNKYKNKNIYFGSVLLRNIYKPAPYKVLAPRRLKCYFNPLDLSH